MLSESLISRDGLKRSSHTGISQGGLKRFATNEPLRSGADDHAQAARGQHGSDKLLRDNIRVDMPAVSAQEHNRASRGLIMMRVADSTLHGLHKLCLKDP